MADYKAKEIGEVKELGLIYQVDASLDKQILALSKVGVQHPFLVTPEEAAMIRIAEVSDDWTRTSMAPIAVKGERPVLYKTSPLMNLLMAQVAVKAHASEKYPMFGREFYESAKNIAESERGVEPEDRTAHILQGVDDYDLTPEMDDARFILGKHTSEYFKKFNHPKIRVYNLSTDKLSEDECIVNYLWFFRPGYGSGLGCGGRGLDLDDSAFGVLRKSAEGASQNAGYSLTSVKSAIGIATPKTLDVLGLTGLGKNIVNELERNILATLRKG